eukprot:4513021-Pleurochrysis_carterae.AAC.2
MHFDVAMLRQKLSKVIRAFDRAGKRDLKTERAIVRRALHTGSGGHTCSGCGGHTPAPGRTARRFGARAGRVKPTACPSVTANALKAKAGAA